MQTNCASCNAPLLPKAEKCEYCGRTIHQVNKNDHGSKTNPGYLNIEIPGIIKPDTYQSNENSIKPQLDYKSSNPNHWTAIVGFLISLLVLLGSMGGNQDQDSWIGFIFLAALAGVFSYIAKATYNINNWLTVSSFIFIVVAFFFMIGNTI